MIWKRVGSILRFCYDERGMLSLDSTCIAVGNHLKYLCCLLNSKMGHYLLQSTPNTGTGDLLVSVQAVEPLLIPPPRDDSFDELFNRLAGVCSDVACRVADKNNCVTDQNSHIAPKNRYAADQGDAQRRLEEACYALYGLEEEERAYIEHCVEMD